MQGGVQTIKLEFVLEQKLFNATATAGFGLAGTINDSLKNLTCYIIQQQLNMETQALMSQVQMGWWQKEMD